MGWALIRGWALLTFSAFRMGAYSRWALIRGWALIRINTVYNKSRNEQSLGETSYILLPAVSPRDDDGNGSEDVSLKMNSRFFNLCRVYSSLLKMASVGEFPWS